MLYGDIENGLRLAARFLSEQYAAGLRGNLQRPTHYRRRRGRWRKRYPQQKAGSVLCSSYSGFVRVRHCGGTLVSVPMSPLANSQQTALGNRMRYVVRPTICKMIRNSSAVQQGNTQSHSAQSNDSALKYPIRAR